MCENEIKVIDCNLRVSRSFPSVSKTFNISFIEITTNATVGKDAIRVDLTFMDIDYVCVKAPVFSFSRLQGADPILRVEMASTGSMQHCFFLSYFCCPALKIEVKSRCLQRAHCEKIILRKQKVY